MSNTVVGNKKGLSPLIATILLVFFALIVGAGVMQFAEDYVPDAPELSIQPSPGSYINIDNRLIDNGLKDIQIDYIIGRINLEEYLRREQEVLPTIRT